MPTENDPLAEAEAEDEGPCTKCEGGYITVKPAYALHLFPDPTAAQVAGLDADQVAVLWATVESNRRAAMNSVYPCRRCLPAAFVRWAGGHLALGHDALRCPDCIETMGGNRAARRAAKALDVTAPTPRRDLQ